MKKYSILLIMLISLGWGCNDEAFLDKEPTNILLDNQIWGDKSLVLSVVADLYDRVPEYQTISGWWDFASFDEGFASAGGDYWRHKNQEYGYDEWSNWDYGLIREVTSLLKNVVLQISSILPTRHASWLKAALFVPIFILS